jgi:hypothetical protein
MIFFSSAHLPRYSVFTTHTHMHVRISLSTMKFLFPLFSCLILSVSGHTSSVAISTTSGKLYGTELNGGKVSLCPPRSIH